MLQYAYKAIKKASSFLADSTKQYILGLLFSTGRKNCSHMSSELGVSYHSISKYFDDFEYQEKHIKAFFIFMANLFATEENPGVLIVDPTQIQKLYSKKLERLCYDFNNSIKTVSKGITCVTAVWSNGKVLIPLEFDFWTRKKDLECKEKYRKKTMISKDIIVKLKDKIPFAYVLLDGAYGNEYCLKFLHENDLQYSIRMPKNRKVIVDNLELKLKDQPRLKHKRNGQYKTVQGTYKGIPDFFTAHKRKGKNGTPQVVFIVSNLKGLPPKKYVEAYAGRWPVEKMFRTLKQSLGLQQCQSIFEKKQRAHIFATFLAFTELEIQKINKKEKSPEQILKILRSQNHVKNNAQLCLMEGFIM